MFSNTRNHLRIIKFSCIRSSHFCMMLLNILSVIKQISLSWMDGGRLQMMVNQNEETYKIWNDDHPVCFRAAKSLKSNNIILWHDYNFTNLDNWTQILLCGDLKSAKLFIISPMNQPVSLRLSNASKCWANNFDWYSSDHKYSGNWKKTRMYIRVVLILTILLLSGARRVRNK